jgi:hypothetical protein
MSESPETKRLWRTALLVAGVGLLVLIPLAWLAVRMVNDANQRKIMAANEADALYALEQIAAAEHIYFQTFGEYATLPQLAEAGVLQTSWSGDPPASHGYTFTFRLTPKTAPSGPAYSVNADPQLAGGRAATGRRHFFVSSEVTGIRFNEERPATATDKPR